MVSDAEVGRVNFTWRSLRADQAEPGTSATHCIEKPRRRRVKRVKKISKKQFEEVIRRNWVPVRLVGDALPDFARGIPKQVLHTFLASGQYKYEAPYKSAMIPSGNLIGGMDVYRNAPDDPVALNKDWYAVVSSDQDETMFLVEGPIKDDEHWIDDIPKRYAGVQVVGVPKKEGK